MEASPGRMILMPYFLRAMLWIALRNAPPTYFWRGSRGGRAR